MSFYAYIYVETASSLNGLVSLGITSNVSTSPAGGSNAVNPINTGITLISSGFNTGSYFPSFNFTVTTSGYYYSFISKASDGSLTGTYVIGARTTSIVRIG